MATASKRIEGIGAVLAVAMALLVGPEGAGGGLSAARAQAGHGAPPTPRPLHQRLLAADAAVVARFEEALPGRLRLRTENTLFGSVPERFEVKHAPSKSAPLAPDDRALLLLRGARSPYLLVDMPHETIRLVDPDMSARWSEAVTSLDRLRDEPRRWVPLYLGWIDEGPATLRELALRGLADPRAPFQPLEEALLDERAAVALDPTRPVEVRRASALLAMRLPASTARLLEAVPSGESDADAEVTLVVFQGGMLHRSPALPRALRRALAQSRADLRNAALHLLERQPSLLDEEMRGALRELERREESGELREQLERLLKRPVDR